MKYQEAVRAIVKREENYRRAVEALRRRLGTIRTNEQVKRDREDFKAADILEAKGDTLQWVLKVLADAEEAEEVKE